MKPSQRKLQADDVSREVLVHLWDNYVQYEIFMLDIIPASSLVDFQVQKTSLLLAMGRAVNH